MSYGLVLRVNLATMTNSLSQALTSSVTLVCAHNKISVLFCTVCSTKCKPNLFLVFIHAVVPFYDQALFSPKHFYYSLSPSSSILDN